MFETFCVFCLAASSAGTSLASLFRVFVLKWLPYKLMYIFCDHRRVLKLTSSQFHNASEWT